MRRQGGPPKAEAPGPGREGGRKTRRRKIPHCFPLHRARLTLPIPSGTGTWAPDDQPAARGLGCRSGSDLSGTKYSSTGRDPGGDEETVIYVHRTSEPAWAKRGQDPTWFGPQGRKGETLPLPRPPTPVYCPAEAWAGPTSDLVTHWPAAVLLILSHRGSPSGHRGRRNAGMSPPSPRAHPSEQFPVPVGSAVPHGGFGKKKLGGEEGIRAQSSHRDPRLVPNSNNNSPPS